MTRANDIARGYDFSTGIDAGEVVPHIIPGVLYPAVAGKLLDGSTSHSGAYGTAQADGFSYYYTDIKGSKPIKDPRIGAHFGSQRHKTKSVQLLEQETATHGSNVYSIDGREWCRIVGNWTLQTNNDLGHYNHVGTGETTNSAYMEITGYFSDMNWLGYSGTTRDVNVSVDGGTVSANTNMTATVTNPLGGRYVDAGSLVNLGLSQTLGIHTLKIANVNGDYLGAFYGIELIAQDTSSTANKSKIQIPAQNVVSYGKKFSIPATAQHYDPFNGFTSGSSVTAYVDTATSLGVEGWKNSSTYYRPYNGGRVVKWIASDGTIKTSVNMMPPNAQNIAGSAISAKANASVANDTYLPTFSGAIDHSQAEVAKTFHWREFGNGSANGNATYADASMLNTQDDIAYVMDDGLTSLSAYQSAGGGGSATTKDRLSHGSGDYSYITFIGTGITFDGTVWADNAMTTHQVAQNLPYGTHILKVFNNSLDIEFHVDGIKVYDSTNGPGHTVADITFHQPKMPPIPEDAVVIADYMLMADFVKQTGTGSDIYGQISKGVRYISASRDHFHDSAGAFDTTNSGTGHAEGIGLRIRNGNDASSAKLPFFGTTAGFIVEASDNAGYSVQLPHGTGATKTALDNTTSNQYDILTIAETVTLGTPIFNLTYPTGYNHYGSYVASPIHTSHHYQTFETPFLRELVGGDRNMEQNNLIVTPDGKSWDEVTRDTSYIGKSSLSVKLNDDITSEATMIFQHFRGQTPAGTNLFNKDWAIAYDRFIALRDGEYNFSCFFRGSSSGVAMYARMSLNGTYTVILTSDAESGQEGFISWDQNLHIKRGDYIQFPSSQYIEGANYYNNVNITRL